ncbi:MAG: PDZ domain-containing protein [Clostridiales bacterium]|nr:PDZ domain-containing protein [Clostridiales bacterium]
MNKKISIGLALTLVILTAAVSFTLTMSYSQQIYNKLLPDLAGRLDRRFELEEVEGVVNAHYYYVDRINNNTLNNFLADGYITGIGDSYSSYLTPAQYREYTDKLEGKKHGTGIVVGHKQDCLCIYVAGVAPGSPADKAGLEKGDSITKVDGNEVNLESYDELLAKLEGMSLKTVTLTYKRGEKEKTTGLMIGYELQSVVFSLHEKIGYIRITGFFKSTPGQLENAVKELTNKGAKAFIFDVRNTSEGTIKYAASTVDNLVPLGKEGSQVIATAYKTPEDFKAKQNAYDTFPSTPKELTLAPMIVLINSKTSGPAELFAVTLTDYKKAELCGVRSAGNDSMQNLLPLKSGGAVLITVARVRPYVSESYEDGLQPHIEERLDADKELILDRLSFEEDSQLQAAYESLMEGLE